MASLLVRKELVTCMPVYISELETYEGLTDAEKITNLIKESKRIGFLYLSPAVPKSSVAYHYYNLK